MGPYVSDHLVREIEKNGAEAAVTVVVDGTVVTGTLTPVRCYKDWLAEVISRGKLGGGHVVLRGNMPPISSGQSAEVRSAWEDAIEEAGIDPEDRTFPQFALKNARVRSGAPETWHGFPYLLVSAPRVGAITVGHPERAATTQGA